MPVSAILPRTALLGAWMLLCVACIPAQAGGVEFPPGSRVGMAPAPGLSPSRFFMGFENIGDRVVVLIAEFPPHEYQAAIKGMLESASGTPGVANVSREIFLTQSGAAHLISSDQEVQGATVRKWLLVSWNDKLPFMPIVTLVVPHRVKARYPDSEMRKMLASLTMREQVPNDEILQSMPFKVQDLAGFRFARAITPGSALLLTDDERPRPDTLQNPYMVLTIGTGTPSRPEERERFARQMIGAIPGLTDIRIVTSEPMRIAALPGFEIRIEAKDQRSNSPVTIVQWLRFGTGGFFRMVGVSPSDRWTESFARFRRVRDGLGLP